MKNRILSYESAVCMKDMQRNWPMSFCPKWSVASPKLRGKGGGGCWGLGFAESNFSGTSDYLTEWSPAFRMLQAHNSTSQSTGSTAYHRLLDDCTYADRVFWNVKHTQGEKVTSCLSGSIEKTKSARKSNWMLLDLWVKKSNFFFKFRWKIRKIGVKNRTVKGTGTAN